LKQSSAKQILKKTYFGQHTVLYLDPDFLKSPDPDKKHTGARDLDPTQDQHSQDQHGRKVDITDCFFRRNPWGNFLSLYKYCQFQSVHSLSEKHLMISCLM
jgi:hypothetical protein